MKKILKILNPKHIKFLMFISLFSLLVVFIEMLGISMLLPLLETLFNNNSVSFVSNITNFFFDKIFILDKLNERIIFLSFSIIIIFTIKTVIISIFLWLRQKFVYIVQADLSLILFKKYLNQKYKFHINNNSAFLIRNINTEVPEFTSHVLNSIIILFTEFLLFASISVVLYLYDPLSFFISISYFSFIFLLFYFFLRKNTVKWGFNRQIFEGKKFFYIQQSLESIKELKINKKESYYINNFNDVILKLANVTTLYNTFLQLPRILIEYLVIILACTIIITFVFLDKDTHIIFSTFSIFAIAFLRLMPSLKQFINSYQKFKFSIPVINILYDQIYSDFNEENIVYDKEINFKKNIIFENISFKYNDKNNYFNLQDINITIQKNTSIGIVGKSGEGKSTFVNLLIGILEPYSGNIKLDNKVINTPLYKTNLKIGYVPQNSYMFDCSIVENIAYGINHDDVDFSKVKEVLKQVELYKDIEKLPNKYNTNVGEKGVKLSGGQIQRIAIARALYTTPDLLILDEITNSLDSNTEIEIIKTIEKLMLNKTIIIISHSSRILKNCNKTYEIKNSKLKLNE